MSIPCTEANLFPQISEDGKDTVFRDAGDYRIKQAKRYITKHSKPSALDKDQLEFVVELCSTHDDLVRVRFISRHFSSEVIWQLSNSIARMKNNPSKDGTEH